MLAAGFLAASSVVQGQSQPLRQLPQPQTQAPRNLLRPPTPHTMQPLHRLPFAPVMPKYPSAPDLPPVYVQPPSSARVFLAQSPLPPLVKGRALLLMPPDNMPCLIPDPAALEHMPMKRLQNINPRDSIPNGIPHN